MQIAKRSLNNDFHCWSCDQGGQCGRSESAEHMVDTVLYFEGDRHASYRILRAVKNRFGSTNEIGVFEMQGTGLEEVSNPSEYLLEGRLRRQRQGVLWHVLWRDTSRSLWKFRHWFCESNFWYSKKDCCGNGF